MGAAGADALAAAADPRSAQLLERPVSSRGALLDLSATAFAVALSGAPGEAAQVAGDVRSRMKAAMRRIRGDESVTGWTPAGGRLRSGRQTSQVGMFVRTNRRTLVLTASGNELLAVRRGEVRSVCQFAKWTSEGLRVTLRDGREFDLIDFHDPMGLRWLFEGEGNPHGILLGAYNLMTLYEKGPASSCGPSPSPAWPPGRLRTHAAPATTSRLSRGPRFHAKPRPRKPRPSRPSREFDFSAIETVARL